MKVLLVSSLYHPYSGGAERVVRIIAEGLVKEGHEAVVVACGRQPGCRTRTVDGVKIYELGLKNIYWPFDGRRPAAPLRALWHTVDAYNLVAARAVGQVIDRERPSLVNTHNLYGFSACVWPEVKRRGLRLVHTLHDYWLLCGNSSMYRSGVKCETLCRKCRVYSAPRRRLSEVIDAVSSDGKFVLAQHRAQGLFERAQPRIAIYNASNAEVRVPPSSDPRRGELRLGFLGRVEPAKGVEELLRACTAIPDGWELLVGGRGNPRYEMTLRERFASPRVKFLGFVEPAELFTNIDVLVVPSLWDDPLPTVIFEAFAHGVPVIGARRGGIPELIEEGKTGVLFAPEAPGELEAAIRRFLADAQLARGMRADTLARARDFTAERLVKHYLDLYERVLKLKRELNPDWPETNRGEDAR